MQPLGKGVRQVAVHNLSRPEVRPVVVKYCASFLCQLRGLSFRRSLELDRGLLLVQKRDSRVDSAIHMMGVFMDLGVVWINQAGEIVDIRLARRWRPAYVCRLPARYVLEINPERLEDFCTGEYVHFEEAGLD